MVERFCGGWWTLGLAAPAGVLHRIEPSQIVAIDVESLVQWRVGGHTGIEAALWQRLTNIAQSKGNSARSKNPFDGLMA
jgi:hypothetical protein